MNGTIPKLGLAALLAAAGLLAAGCDEINDASTLGQRQGTTASVVAKGNAEVMGTDEAIEDSELTTKVNEAILADRQLQSQHIEVETEDSEVTLTGKVESQSLRERAVQLAGSVNGVVQVRDRLEVGS